MSNIHPTAIIDESAKLADDVVVNSAKLKDGMLLVELEKVVPEEKKPRTIDIK